MKKNISKVGKKRKNVVNIKKNIYNYIHHFYLAVNILLSFNKKYFYKKYSINNSIIKQINIIIIYFDIFFFLYYFI